MLFILDRVEKQLLPWRKLSTYVKIGSHLVNFLVIVLCYDGFTKQLPLLEAALVWGNVFMLHHNWEFYTIYFSSLVKK